MDDLENLIEVLNDGGNWSKIANQALAVERKNAAPAEERR